MIFRETNITDVFEIIPEKKGDDRGFFARGFCEQEFKEHGISFHMVQANIGFSKYKNTVRGLHYQIEPHSEKKLVQCVKGAIYDVIVDLRPDSPTYRQWVGRELTEADQAMMFVPEGCAHGYQTLVNDSQISYMVSSFYAPKAERGIRWDDPAFDIHWKNTDNLILSEKDKNWSEFML